MRFDLKPIVENTNRVNASTMIRRFTLELDTHYKDLYGKNISLLEEDNVKLFCELVNRSISLNQTRDSVNTKQSPVKITYTKSNLQKGYVFWFICNRCNQKSRHLYCPQHSEDFLCRKCHRLAYEKQNKKGDREVAKLLNNPMLLSQYMNSSSWKQNLYALDAMIMSEEIEKKAVEKVNSLYS